ncbi:MAG: DUF4124 domain-containing protein [Proteobacteria bacterium]|nr:DUF4124 domain-containing protein [Pseudomonadota bacterium]
MKKIVLILILVASVAHGEIYKWTDNKGAHFVGSIEEVPAEYRSSAQAMKMYSDESTVDDKAISKHVPDMNGGDLKDRMMNDQGIMDLIREMQFDKDMQALLNDSAIMSAIQAGDINTLQNNPDFLKILDNPRVKEILNRMNPGEIKK